MNKRGNNYKPTSNALTTSPTSVLAFNENRTGLILFNTGDNDCTFTISGVGPIKIKAGDHVAFLSFPPINAISAQSSTGTTTLVSWEC